MMTVTAPLPGSVLPNGATVIDVWNDTSQMKFGDMRPQGVVLATIVNTGLPRGAEFVTWNWYVERDQCITVSGTYRDNIFPAAKDFARRIGTRGE